MFVKGSTAIDGLSGNGKLAGVIHKRPLYGTECPSGRGGLYHKGLHWTGYVFKIERAEGLEDKVKLTAHMVAH